MCSSITIFSVSNSRYLKHLKVLLSSVTQNFPESTLYFHLININKDEIAELININQNINYYLENIEFNSGQEEKAYCANIRAKTIYKLLLNKEIDLLLYLDADSIVRKDLSDLVSLIRLHEITILHRFLSKDEHLKFATGVIGIKKTNNSLAFIKHWSDLVDNNIYEWFTDQLSFSKTYNALASEINLCNIPKKFIDWEFSLTTSIWVGKGPRKYEKELYKLEEQYYLLKLKQKTTYGVSLQIYKTRLFLFIQKILLILSKVF